MPRKAPTLQEQLNELALAKEALARSEERLRKQLERRVQAQAARADRVVKAAGSDEPTSEEIVAARFGAQHDSPARFFTDPPANAGFVSKSVVDMGGVQVDQVIAANDRKRDEVAALRESRKGMPGYGPNGEVL